MISKLCCLLFLAGIVLESNFVKSAEILFVAPVPSFSHFIIPLRISEELARRGHQVTVIGPYPHRKKMDNYTDVSVVENIVLMDDLKKELFAREKLGLLDNLLSLFDMTSLMTNATLHHKNVQELIQSGRKFDVVLVEHFLNEAFLGFGHLFEAPTIVVFTHAANAMNNYLFANPAPPSYVPGSGGDLTRHMNFLQRVQNFIATMVFDGLVQFYHLPKQENIFKDYIKDVKFEDVLYNASLMLTNSHPSISNPNPLVPSIIEVGGLHIKTKPIPDEVKEFLDNSKEGVVLFSMGSNLRSDDLKPETRKAILKAFSKLKQNVLWKFEADLPEAPKNVKIMSWIPQEDILSHPNVRAFITHGGRMGTLEAVYHGVPIIGVPVFGDQQSNVAAAVNDGYALRINLDDLNEENLSWALNEILTNTKYTENVKQRSRLIKDRPMKPLDAAVYWIEHVIRNQGAPHLRSAGLDLKWYQREMLDVIAFIVAIFGLVIFLVVKAVKKVCKCVCGKCRQTPKKQKKA